MALSTKIMTAAQDRKKAWLALCLCLLAVSVTYRMLNPYRQERVAKLPFPASVSQTARTEPSGPDQAAGMKDRDVLLDSFLNPPHHSGKVSRDVFQKEEPASPEAPVEPGAAVAGQPESARPPEADPRLQVQEELSRFKSFGYVQGRDEKVLFLERGKDILMIREGDRIDGKYVVKSITEKQLVIRAESIGEDVRIDLGKF